MADFKKTYLTGRSVAGLVVLFGWGVAVLGLIVFAGNVTLWFASDATLAVLTYVTGGTVGLVAFLIGLGAVAGAQMMRAGFDTADMTREMLLLTRSQASPRSRPDPISASRLPSVSDAPPLTPPPPPERPRLSSAVPAKDSVPRPEPTMKAGATTTPRPHPIFSAKPPR